MMSIASKDGIKLAYARSGKGPPLVAMNTAPALFSKEVLTFLAD